MTRLWQFNATVATIVILCGAYHYGLLELVALCFAGGLLLNRVFG